MRFRDENNWAAAARRAIRSIFAARAFRVKFILKVAAKDAAAIPAATPSMYMF